MDSFFIGLLNRSFTAGGAAALLLPVWLLLRRAPRKVSCLLWAIPFLRLLCPFSLKSVFSLLPVSPQPIPVELASMETPPTSTGIGFMNSAAGSALPELAPSGSPPLQGWLCWGECLWLLGVAAVAVLAVCLLCDPLEKPPFPAVSDYDVQSL